MYRLYTDGACLGNPGPGGWGAVLISEGAGDGGAKELSGHEPRTTNNRMEMAAAIQGLEATPPGSEVRVVSDSSYVVNTMTRGWKRNANQDLWAALDRAVEARRVTWEWVKGHAGHPGNERADQLAAAAARAGSGRGGPVVNGGAHAEPRLTHVDASGKAHMVDVGDKPETERVAVARGAIVMQPETLRLVREGGFEKGDVLGVARVAGVMAAKNTSQLIPLCHSLPLTQVTVEFDDSSSDDRIEITATARTTYRTGVEMEALTAVAVAALTVYDMCKAADRAMRIEDVRLVRKSGGRSGDYSAE